MPRALCAAIVLATGVAHASPLEPLWQAKQPCSADSVTAWGDTLVTRRGTQLLPLERATGVARPAIELVGAAEQGWAIPRAAAGELLLLGNGQWFGVIDRTGKPAWEDRQLVADTGSPMLLAVAGDVIVARPNAGGEGIEVVRRDGATGAVTWKRTARGTVGVAHAVDDGTHLYTIVTPSYYDDKMVVTAFALATGALLWRAEVKTGQPNGVTTPLPEKSFAGAAGQLFAALPSGVHALDGATGKAVLIDVPGISSHERSIEIRGSRVYVAREDGVTALDAATRKVLWATALRTPALAAATDDAVYAIDDTRTLHALDPRTGAPVASYSLGDSLVAYTAHDGRGPVVIACHDDRLTAYGPAAGTTAPERATITGRLLCRGCGPHRRPKPMPDIEVSGGGAAVRTDRNGAFTLEVTARGVVRLWFAVGSPPEPFSSWRDPSVLVVLRGKQRYALGAVGAKPEGVELP